MHCTCQFVNGLLLSSSCPYACSVLLFFFGKNSKFYWLEIFFYLYINQFQIRHNTTVTEWAFSDHIMKNEKLEASIVCTSAWIVSRDWPKCMAKAEVYNGFWISKTTSQVIIANPPNHILAKKVTLLLLVLQVPWTVPNNYFIIFITW